MVCNWLAIWPSSPDRASCENCGDCEGHGHGMGMMPRLSRVDVFMTALSIIRASAFARS